MIHVAINENGEEYIYESKLIKSNNRFCYCNNAIILPKGTIKKIIGKELTYKDKPVEI